MSVDYDMMHEVRCVTNGEQEQWDFRSLFIISKYLFLGTGRLWAYCIFSLSMVDTDKNQLLELCDVPYRYLLLY